AELAQLVGRADAGEEHELRRVEGAARQDDFALRLQAVILAVLAVVKGDRTAVLHFEAGRQRASNDLEVRPLHRREQEPRRGAAATALVNGDVGAAPRSEEHTSELTSRENLVCRLLLEKKKIC